MSEALLVRHCSPTLAGLKTGNLFSCAFASKAALYSCLRCWNRILTGKGLRALPMRFQNGRALIYVYRPARLASDFQHTLTHRLLRERGYCTENTEQCVAQLARHICAREAFPHEIGLFLGYPPEDVCGFIENRAEGCKCVGCWKVYGDAEAAQRTFAKFKKCTAVYCRQFENGKSIERLTVAG